MATYIHTFASGRTLLTCDDGYESIPDDDEPMDDPEMEAKFQANKLRIKQELAEMRAKQVTVKEVSHQENKMLDNTETKSYSLNIDNKEQRVMKTTEQMRNEFNAKVLADKAKQQAEKEAFKATMARNLERIAQEYEANKAKMVNEENQKKYDEMKAIEAKQEAEALTYKQQQQEEVNTVKEEKQVVNAMTATMTYRELQLFAKELRSQGYEVGKLNAKGEVLLAAVNAALALQNERLREKANAEVFGNMSPRHQAGTVVNLMARSKARKARENAPQATNHNELNKEFYKRQQELGVGVKATAPKPVSNSFSYKNMKLEKGAMSW